jgi:hypothetical protein
MKFREDINGLRAFAVAFVVFYHFDIPGFRGGFVGVDVFFVISGYLMSQIIFSRMAERPCSANRARARGDDRDFTIDRLVPRPAGRVPRVGQAQCERNVVLVQHIILQGNGLL